MIQKLLSNNMDDIYKNTKESNPNKKRKILVVFDDLIADVLSNKKFTPIISELFIRGRKLNTSVVFITQSYFAVPKKYYTKFNKLFCYENSKQRRTSTNCI